MRFLESAPRRYDWGMQVITFGGVTRVHESIAEHVAAAPHGRALEIGCGTGAITERLACRGIRVLAFDQNPDMLEIARSRVSEDDKHLLELREMTASEVDAFSDDSFSSVLAGFSLSEMSRNERRFVLKEIFRILTTDGLLVLGDEVVSVAWWQRCIAIALRLPQLMLAWLLTGTWSTPIPDLRNEVSEAGFTVVFEQRWRLGTLAVFVCRKVGSESE